MIKEFYDKILAFLGIDTEEEEEKASEMTEDVSGPSNHVNHINPVEVQGSEDIMGAETGGRYYGSTLSRYYPGLNIPNPRDYPTPMANNPWEPYISIKTYGDIDDALLQPYPSAMEWATDPRNYKPYKSQEDYTSFPGNY